VTKDGWYRCDDLHPADDEEVLCLNEDGGYYIGWWDDELEGGRWRLRGADAMFDEKPWYWQRLPARPKRVKWRD